MVRRMLDNLEPEMHQSQPLQHQIAPLMQSDHKLGQKSYKPLLERPTSSKWSFKKISLLFHLSCPSSSISLSLSLSCPSSSLSYPSSSISLSLSCRSSSMSLSPLPSQIHLKSVTSTTKLRKGNWQLRKTKLMKLNHYTCPTPWQLHDQKNTIKII